MWGGLESRCSSGLQGGMRKGSYLGSKQWRGKTTANTAGVVPQPDVNDLRRGVDLRGKPYRRGSVFPFSKEVGSKKTPFVIGAVAPIVPSEPALEGSASGSRPDIRREGNFIREMQNQL